MEARAGGAVNCPGLGWGGAEPAWGSSIADVALEAAFGESLAFEGSEGAIR
jgi:hypothetical protein